MNWERAGSQVAWAIICVYCYRDAAPEGWERSVYDAQIERELLRVEQEVLN